MKMYPSKDKAKQIINAAINWKMPGEDLEDAVIRVLNDETYNDLLQKYSFSKRDIEYFLEEYFRNKKNQEDGKIAAASIEGADEIFRIAKKNISQP